VCPLHLFQRSTVFAESVLLEQEKQFPAFLSHPKDPFRLEQVIGYVVRDEWDWKESWNYRELEIVIVGVSCDSLNLCLKFTLTR